MEQSEGGWGGNGIWSIKNELKIKLNKKSLQMNDFHLDGMWPSSFEGRNLQNKQSN